MKELIVIAIYGYCRISSKTQKDGYGLEVQKKEILLKYKEAEIYEEQYSAKTNERPVFQKVLGKLVSNDTLVVSKLDRLARNTVEGIQIVQELFERNVSVHVLNVGLLENTHMGKFFLTTLLAVAEMERNTIIERTQAGKEIAKLNPDYREGRPPKYTDKQIEWAISLLEKHSYPQVSKMTGISKSTIIRAVRKNRMEDKNG
jgi:DNA invertase Pin-like site-specific DNA recombinase